METDLALTFSLQVHNQIKSFIISQVIIKNCRWSNKPFINTFILLFLSVLLQSLPWKLLQLFLYCVLLKYCLEEHLIACALRNKCYKDNAGSM